MSSINESIHDNPIIKIGIIGCGQMGRKHALNCSKIEGVSVVAIADKDEHRSKTLAQEIGAFPYSTYKDVVAVEALDAVIVATPPDQHGEAALGAIKAGKSVFIEKPIALDMATARALCEAADKAGVVNAVGFHLRYAPLTQKAKALIAGKQVNEVRSVTTTSYYLKLDMPGWFLQRKHSGGPLLEQSLHMFDIARYLVGDITHIFAQGARLVRPELAEFDSEDTMVLAYRISNGALGVHLDSCATTVFNWEIELFGEDWRLLIDYARNQISGYIREKQIQYNPADIDIHEIEIQAFIETIRSKEKILILSNFADATKTLEAMLAADMSLKNGLQSHLG